MTPTYTRAEAVSALMVAGFIAVAREVARFEPDAVVRLRIGRKYDRARGVMMRGILVWKAEGRRGEGA